MKFISRAIGKNATESKREDFDEIKEKFNQYLIASQFDPEYSNIGEIKSSSTKMCTQPVCSVGEVVYGLDADGQLVKLKAVYDTSG